MNYIVRIHEMPIKIIYLIISVYIERGNVRDLNMKSAQLTETSIKYIKTVEKISQSDM